MNKNFSLINNALVDEESKRIFANRVLFSLTSDYEYIKNLLDTNYLKKRNRYVLWGRGYWGKQIITCYPRVNWIGVCDNNYLYNETKFEGIALIKPERLLDEYSDCTIVIATRKYWKEILKQLKSMGIESRRIINLGKVQEEMAKSIYFDLDILPKKENEVFIDGGCFDVTTSKAFIRWSEGSYKKIYAFEPDSKNISRCKKIIKDEDINNIEIYNYALSDKNQYLSFDEDGDEVSKRNIEGSSIVEGRCLQDIVGEEKITFVKLDIEGMELEAIKGMERIIQNDKPKIAVSVYHKREDIWDIPSVLLSLNPAYKFYLRHYSIGEIDTVLYAIDDKNI